jgi:hypothetical protein
MAWRPYENLIDGELSNHVPRKVTGWMRFFRQGRKPLRVTFDLVGDFHEDIRGKRIRLSNPSPSDRDAHGRNGTYVEGLCSVQRGDVGDMTAGISLGPWTESLAQRLMAQHEIDWQERGLTGSEREERRKRVADKYRQHIANGELFYPYASYPYLEWYSAENGRVVLELDPSQVEVLDVGDCPRVEKTPSELARDARNRREAFGSFLTDMAKQFSVETRGRNGERSS